MNASTYASWMQLGFLGVEGSLAQELLTSTRVAVTEEYVRVAMIKSLMAALPFAHKRVGTEGSVSYSNNPGWLGKASKVGKGRSLQHDIVLAARGADNGAYCEVKWLKSPKPESLLMDIWKLWLSRSTMREVDAKRTFLLVGGESEAFRETLNVLRGNKVSLKWSRTKGKLPEPSQVDFNNVLNTTAGAKALLKLLRMGSKGDYRTPPPARRDMIIRTRATWLRPQDVKIFGAKASSINVHWNLALWELTAHGTGIPRNIDWAAELVQLKNRTDLADYFK